MALFGHRERFGSHLGLERVELVCRELGSPQADLKFIHLAGTNGKGSTAALLAQVLQESGLKVGLFTSPHLESYEERFKINGVQVDKEFLTDIVEETEAAISRVEKEYPQLGAVTEFELATAVGLLCFRQAEVDIVVLETGLGGRLDATNVVAPVLSVITTIGLDHTDRLGDSVEEIAAEKGGIIKAGVPVVSGVQPGAAETVLKRIASEKGAPWYSTWDVPWQKVGWSLEGGSLFFPGWGKIEIGLLGEHQLENGAVALLALEQLSALGWPITEQAVRQGMKEAKWPGRLEVLSAEPLVLLDGSHNPEGIAALTTSLDHLRDGSSPKFTFVFGMLETKELKLLDPLVPLAERFVFTAAAGGRFPPKDPAIMVEYAQKRGVKAVGYYEAADALKMALQSPPVCICGSLYLVGTIKRILRQGSVIIA
ncbi:MAG: folylpolyglutamate synthase/dihydrofolate synthase family protein [Limnochordia bacterium]